MEIIKTKSLTAKQFQQINGLWNEEYPLKLKDRFELLLDGVNDYNHYLVEDKDRNILAWAVDFEKDNEIRFSIIVDKNHQGKGLGVQLIKKLKKDLKEFYGWVIDHNDDKNQMEKIMNLLYHSILIRVLKFYITNELTLI